MIPQELQDYCQWIVWQYEIVDGKKTKVPYSPKGYRAMVNKPLTWGTYDEACAVAYQYDGIGFVFTDSDPFIGIDVDHCLYGRVLTKEGTNIMKSLASYTEASPSGQGIHVIGKGKLSDGRRGRRKDNIELYCSGRFFTMTGDTLQQAPIADVQMAVEYMEITMASQFEVAHADQAVPKSYEPSQPVVLTRADKKLLEDIFSSKNGEVLKAMYNGEHPRSGNASEDDLYFCWYINFWNKNDFRQTDRIFRNSKRMRPKWDTIHFSDGMTYGARTLQMSFNKKQKTGRG